MTQIINEVVLDNNGNTYEGELAQWFIGKKINVIRLEEDERYFVFEKDTEKNTFYQVAGYKTIDSAIILVKKNLSSRVLIYRNNN